MHKKNEVVFHVLVNDEPAIYPEWESKSHLSICYRNNNIFPTLKEARAYVNSWLGIYGPMPENVLSYDYTGHGDIIKIVKMPA